MLEIMVIAALVLIFLLFALSVVAPMESHHPFWEVIRSIRSVMDLCSYWVFNLALIFTLLFIAWFAVKGLLHL